MIITGALLRKQIYSLLQSANLFFLPAMKSAQVLLIVLAGVVKVQRRAQWGRQEVLAETPSVLVLVSVV